MVLADSGNAPPSPGTLPGAHASATQAVIGRFYYSVYAAAQHHAWFIVLKIHPVFLVHNPEKN